MSQAPPQPSPPLPAVTSGVVIISNVDWRDYSRFLKLFAERPGYRLTYDRGELEIMSPSLRHDNNDRFLGRMVITLTEEIGLEVKCGGSVTLRRRRSLRGLEPDDCFWIANAARMAGVQELDLRRDPPPDLAIEIDVTSRSLDRMGIYARLNVPEVWRLEGDVLTFLVLSPAGPYAPATHSRSFPFVTPADLLPFLQQARQAGGDNAVIRAFRAWVQQARPAP